MDGNTIPQKRGKTYVIKYDHHGNIQDAYEDNSVRDAEMWKDYVKHELSENNNMYDELLREEQALYENGYISNIELYFGQTKEEF